MMDAATINRTKYLKPPPIELIDEMIEELGVSERQFERFYSIPFSTIGQIRMGNRELPAKFWEVIYLKIKPIYGFDYQKRIEKKPFTKVITSKVEEIDNHGRLGRLKTK